MLGALSPPLRHQTGSSRRAAGVTLVELMVTLAIVAVLLAIALPSMYQFVARKRLEGIAQELVTDLRLLKSHQIQNRPDNGTAIRFGSTADKTCYMVYTRGNNVLDCKCEAAEAVMCGPASATGVRPAPIRQVNIPNSSGISVTAAPRVLAVLGYNAMPNVDADPLQVSVASTSAGELRVSTNTTGVPSLCSVSGAFGAIARCQP